MEADDSGSDRADHSFIPAATRRPRPGAPHDADRPRSADCLLCRGPTVPWLVIPGDFQRPDHPDSYSLRWCRNCRFGQLHPRPDRDHIPEFYKISSYYTQDDLSAAPGPEPRTLLDRLRVKIAWLKDRSVPMDAAWLQGHFSPAARVCDLGCGNGYLLDRLSGLGYEVTGVEPDPKAREAVRTRGHRVLPGTAEELPDEVRRERYDGVLMSHTLEHCLDPGLAVSNAAGLLADRGLLIVETPNSESKGLERAGVLWPWLDVPRHLNFFTRESLRSLLAKSGIAVEAVEHYGYTRQFEPDWIRWERDIRDRFAAKADRSGGLPSPRRGLHSWSLLFATAWSSERQKYDSVRVVGRRSESK
jgi:2-polyprenyl-3-methyl-5-hydroxy-6-metoxy-1,4-benzoquinol methylase